MSLEFADEGLAALQSVHGPDESKKSILIGADGGNLSVSGITPLVFAVAFFLLAAEAGGQEKSGSSQLEDAEDGDGSAEGAVAFLWLTAGSSPIVSTPFSDLSRYREQ